MNTTTSLWDAVRDSLSFAALALADPRPRLKFVHLGLGLLCGQKPKTITSALEWLDQRQQEAAAYLIEENRILRGHLRGRLRLTDEERRRLARHGHRLGRRRLRDVATLRLPTRFFGGIGSSSPGNGRTRSAGAVVRCP